MTEQELIAVFEYQFIIHGLKDNGWTFAIVDDLDGKWGFTHSDNKHIEISRECWPTLTRNLTELALHEVAHAICGHGRHNLEWWDKLMAIGGCGVWVLDGGQILQSRIID